MAEKSNSPDPKIAAQIESTADYYPPGTYSGSLSPGEATVASYLTYYNDLQLTTDPLAYYYIPLTAARKNPKMFAIGVIAPSARVSGLILDRAALNEPPVLPPLPKHVAEPSPAPQAQTERQKQAHAAMRSILTDAFTRRFNRPPNTSEIQCLQSIAWLESSYGNGWKPPGNGSFNYGAIQAGPRWKGEVFSYIDTHPNPDGTSTEYVTNFRKYESAEKGADALVATVYVSNGRQKALDQASQGNTEGFSRALYDTSYYEGFGSTPEIRIANHHKKVAASVRAQAAGLREPLPYDLDPSQTSSSASVTGDGNASTWKGANANAVAGRQAKTANSKLKAITAMYTAAQRTQILDLQQALAAMENTPPLRMLVNPASFSVKGEKIVADSGWTRNGNTVVEHWGNNQDSISASGKLAGFYAVDMMNAVGPGITRMARNYSQAWQNFQSLFLFYKNNGGVFTKDRSSGTDSANLSLVGSVYIYYDSILYIGSFSSLNLTESDTAPHTAEYSFEFSVRAAFLLDNPTQTQTNAIPGITQPSTSAVPVTSAAKFG